MTEESPLLRVLRVHEQVDVAVRPLEQLHADRLTCARGCSDCCIDDLTVFDVEAARIRTYCADVLQSAPHPVGACAFLDDEGACRIYEHRPYVCRTQGLPLRWLDHEAQTEHRDICPLNEAGPPVETLPAHTCWTLGEIEAELAAIQDSSGRSQQRVTLRSLFQSGSA